MAATRLTLKTLAAQNEGLANRVQSLEQVIANLSKQPANTPDEITGVSRTVHARGICIETAVSARGRVYQRVTQSKLDDRPFVRVGQIPLEE